MIRPILTQISTGVAYLGGRENMRQRNLTVHHAVPIEDRPKQREPESLLANRATIVLNHRLCIDIDLGDSSNESSLDLCGRGRRRVTQAICRRNAQLCQRIASRDLSSPGAIRLH